MKRVERSELLDYVTYSGERNRLQASAMRAKELRRVHVGEHLTFLFENTETVRYQIQEMMRVERIVREADIQHELETYNELLGAPGELGCTLLIEIEDPGERSVKLARWTALPKHLYVRVEGGDRVPARFDPRQSTSTRLSTVQYLKFGTAGRVPIAVGTDFAELCAETELSAAQRSALARDLE